MILSTQRSVDQILLDDGSFYLDDCLECFWMDNHSLLLKNVLLVLWNILSSWRVQTNEWTNQSNTMEWSLRDLKFSCVLRGRLNYDLFISCFGSSEFDADDTSKNSVNERLQVATSNRSSFLRPSSWPTGSWSQVASCARASSYFFVRSLSMHHLTHVLSSAGMKLSIVGEVNADLPIACICDILHCSFS